MALLPLLQDVDFRELVSHLRQGFHVYTWRKKGVPFIETSFGRLFTLYHTGRIDTEGEQVALRLLNSPVSQSSAKYEKRYLDLVAEKYPVIRELSEKHGENLQVVTSLLLAAATTPKQPRLEDVLTLAEAAEEWDLDPSTLRHAIGDGKFFDDEYRKSGPRVWLITRYGMERVYGPSNIKKEQ